MPNFRQPPTGETISGPLTMLNPQDNSYMPLVDQNGVAVAPLAPYVYYTKPGGASAATPSTAQVQQLCNLLGPLVAEALVRQSATLSRITTMPQQSPSTGYSSLAATYSYTFGSTAVTNTVNTRNYYGEKVPIDLVLPNPTLIADLANRLGANLAGAIDSTVFGQYPQFSTYSPVGTGGSSFTAANVAACVAHLANTGEPIFLYCLQSQHGPTNFGANGLGLVNDAIAPRNSLGFADGAQTLANAASPNVPLQGVWIMPSPGIVQTGSAPLTTHNLVMTPSAICFTCEIETNINNTNTTPIANAIATGSFGNVTVTIWALNTGSGVQMIYASIAYGVVVGVNANGVQLSS